MLTQHINFKIYNDVVGSGRDIAITPLFLQNHREPWGPNEIFDLAETATLTAGKWETLAEPLELGKIIVDEQREWLYEGDSDLSEDEINRLAVFVLKAE